MTRRLVWLSVLGCVVAIAAAIAFQATRAESPPTAEARSADTSRIERSGTPALVGLEWSGSARAVVTDALWDSASPVDVLLNRTPRVVATDPVPKSDPPRASVRCVRTSEGTAFRLTWQDPTKDQPDVRRPSPADAGGGVRIAHTESTDRSYDAAAVMVPVNRDPEVSPSIQMGEKSAPVELYFWHAVSGAAVMTASGRGTPQRTGRKFASKATYEDGRWQVTFVLPELPRGTPVAFAVWDGGYEQRGGLKSYSLWYAVR